MLTKNIEGKKVLATIVEKEEYGLWVDYMGTRGLVKIVDVAFSSAETKKIMEQSKIGDVIEIIVTNLHSQNDPDEKEKFSGSIKDIDPQKNQFLKYNIGFSCSGKVYLAGDFGYLLELEPDVPALLRKKDGFNFSIGDVVSVVVCNIDANKKRIEVDLKE